MKIAYCYTCKCEIEVKRRFARNYCSKACKQKSYRERNNEKASTSKDV